MSGCNAWLAEAQPKHRGSCALPQRPQPASDHEQDVVGRPARGGPFGDSQILALFWAHTLRVGQGFGIGLPACLSKLLVDQLAGSASSSRIALAPDLLLKTTGRRRLPVASPLRLLRRQMGFERSLGLIGLDRHLLPERLLRLRSLKLS